MTIAIMDALTSLPSRCCLEVVEGTHALQPPSRVYLCWQGTSAAGDIKITNTQQQMHEVYKQAQKQQAAAKRHLQQPDKIHKRQQLLPNAAGAVGDGAQEKTPAAIGGRDDRKLAAAVPVQRAKQLEAAVTPLQQQSGIAAATPNGQQVTKEPTGIAQPTSISRSSKQLFTLEQLKAKTNKELVELLRSRSCPVSGQKTELIRRLLEYQRRLKKAQGTV